MIRRVKLIYSKVKTVLTKSGLPDIDYALNPYIGCIHNCIYCYARLYTRLDEVSKNWGRVVGVKENLINILEREVERYRPGVVGLSTITDPYQPVESIYKLTRKSIEVLLRNSFKVSIQTKNSLVLRDLDIFVRYTNLVDIGFTITTFDNKLAGLTEPFSTPPRLRLEALLKISRNGIKTWIFYGPVIPGLNDSIETIREIINAAQLTQSKVLVDYLHVKSFMYSSNYLLRDRVKRVSKEWWSSFLNSFLKTCSEYGVECVPGFAEPIYSSRRLDEYFAK